MIGRSAKPHVPVELRSIFLKILYRILTFRDMTLPAEYQYAGQELRNFSDALPSDAFCLVSSVAAVGSLERVSSKVGSMIPTAERTRNGKSTYTPPRLPAFACAECRVFWVTQNSKHFFTTEPSSLWKPNSWLRAKGCWIDNRRTV